MFRIVVALFAGSCISMSSCTSEPKTNETMKSVDVATGHVATEVQEDASEMVSKIKEPESEAKADAIPTPSEEPKTIVKLVETKKKPVVKKKPVEAVKKVVTKPKPRPKPQKVAPTFANITFDKMVHEFGEIDEGDKITHKFKFKNTGNAPLIIDNVDVSCGCTVPTYPFIPIGPGETGEIGVIYNSKGKFGTQKPSITIKTNASQPIVKLYMSGSIKHVFEKTTVDSTDTKG